MIKKIILLIFILFYVTFGYTMQIIDIQHYIGKTCKIYYNGRGTTYGKILRFDTRYILNDEIVILEKNSYLNYYQEVHYLIESIDKLED